MLKAIRDYKAREAAEAREYIKAQAAVEATLAILKSAAEEASAAVRSLHQHSPIGHNFDSHRAYFEAREARDEMREIESAIRGVMFRVSPSFVAAEFGRIDKDDPFQPEGSDLFDGDDPFYPYGKSDEIAEAAE